MTGRHEERGAELVLETPVEHHRRGCVWTPERPQVGVRAAESGRLKPAELAQIAGKRDRRGFVINDPDQARTLV